MMGRSTLFALSATLLACPAAAPALACAIDGTPSLSANGVVVRLTRQAPRAADLARWAPFTAARSLAAGTAIRFAEDRRQLLQALPPAVLSRPFRWSMGDGRTLSGFAVSHSYGRAGTYRVAVSAYDQSGNRWFLFDAALVAITAPPRR